MYTDSQGQSVLDYDKYRKIGIRFDDDGDIEDFNPNAFARHLCRTFDIAIRYDILYYLYKDNYYQAVTELELKRLLYNYFNSLVPDAWTTSFEYGYLAAYKRLMPRCEELISGIDVINLTNGIFSVSSGKLLPHDKKIFTATQIPVEYNEDSDCPVFKDFLYDIFNQDKSLVSITQELMGYCLTNSTQAHKFFLLFGTGRNGKSVLLKVITALVGADNTCNLSLKSFGIPFELAEIVDKRVNISTESEVHGATLRTDKLKAIVAGDSIQINPKNEKPFSHLPITKLIFAINRLPATADTSEGFVDRLIILPFDKKYVPNPKNDMQGKLDPNLKDKLLLELDGIFIFALEGLKRLIANDYIFSESKRATKLLRQFVASNNPFVDFIDTRLTIEDAVKIPRTQVYDDFKAWAKYQGFVSHSNMSARTFYSDLTAELSSRGIYLETPKIRGTIYFRGITLRTNTTAMNKKKPVATKDSSKKVVGADSMVLFADTQDDTD